MQIKLKRAATLMAITTLETENCEVTKTWTKTFHLLGITVKYDV